MREHTNIPRPCWVVGNRLQDITGAVAIPRFAESANCARDAALSAAHRKEHGQIARHLRHILLVLVNEDVEQREHRLLCRIWIIRVAPHTEIAQHKPCTYLALIDGGHHR